MASLQQIVEQLALLAANGNNVTTGPNTTPTTSTLFGPIDLLTSLYKTLFSASALRDWAVLLVIGSLFQTARGLLSSLWNTLINSFFITAVFEDRDDSFQWIMHWLSKQPSWKRARNVQISTSNFGIYTGEIDSGEYSSAQSRKVAFLPAVSESYTLWYKYRWMGVTRTREGNSYSERETVILSIMTLNRGLLTEITQNAKEGYIKAQMDDISIYVSEKSNDCWRVLATRPKRSLSSIILDPGIAELVVEDVRDFLRSKEWYSARGIPFRRGYLLHGAPGSGKTSLIHSIAGELNLDVYIISLSRSGMDDTDLANLISALPERCIALMEDIDAAFHHGISREGPSTESGNGEKDSDVQKVGGGVSLSGVLNALDGIAAQEGRVLFATTNKYHSLDPALCRPGRMDLHIKFGLASRFQAEELFKRFYAPLPSASARGSESRCTRTGENGHVDMSEDPLIDLSEPQTSIAPSSPPLPSRPSPPSSPSCSSSVIMEKQDAASSEPSYVGVVHSRRAPTLSHDEMNALAAQFALAVPERQFSMASIQGFLMMHKTNPFKAVADVEGWVQRELAERRGEEETRTSE